MARSAKGGSKVGSAREHVTALRSCPRPCFHPSSACYVNHDVCCCAPVIRTRFHLIYTETTAKMPKAHGLNDDEVADLKEAFSMFDIDGDGKFSVSYVWGPVLGRARGRSGAETSLPPEISLAVGWGLDEASRPFYRTIAISLFLARLSGHVTWLASAAMLYRVL